MKDISPVSLISRGSLAQKAKEDPKGTGRKTSICLVLAHPGITARRCLAEVFAFVPWHCWFGYLTFKISHPAIPTKTF